jgi:hypothetical protein
MTSVTTVAIPMIDFSYVWTADPISTAIVSLPLGTYSYLELQKIFQSAMDQNYHYLLDAKNNKVYYMELSTSPMAFVSTPLPKTLPAGYTLPAGATWKLPIIESTPQIIVSKAFSTLIGIPSGTYPATIQAKEYQKPSTIVLSFIDSLRAGTTSLMYSVAFLDSLALKIQDMLCMSKEDAFLWFVVFILVCLLIFLYMRKQRQTQ